MTRKDCYILRSCLADAMRMLLFIVEQVFLLMGEVWLMCKANAQCTVRSENRPKVEKNFCCLS